MAINEVYSERGKICRKLGFVLDGVFKVVRTNSNEDEFIQYFTTEGHFAVDIDSFTNKTPSKEYIKALKSFNKHGASIINISSIASVKPTPMSVVYSASKSAVDSITQTLSKELGGKTIRVNSILPGPTQTEGNQIIGTDIENFVVANTSFGRIGQPNDISELAVFLASDDPAWITGQKIGVSGGFE